MTFPSNHRWPGELRTFQLLGYSFADEGLAEEIAFEQGEDRAQQRYSFSPQIVSVSTMMNQGQFDRFVEWYEQDVQAGAERFDCYVAAQGGLHLAWWEAQFVGPWRSEASGRGHYEVVAEIILLDGPYTTRTAPGLRANVATNARVVGNLMADGTLGARVSAAAALRALIPSPPLLARVSAAAALAANLADIGYITESGIGYSTEGGTALGTE